MLEAALARHPAPARVEAHKGSAARDPHATSFGGARAQDGVRATAAWRAHIDDDPTGRADAERPRVPSAREPQAHRALCDRPDRERDREVERRAPPPDACQATGRRSRRASFAHARERPASRRLDEALEGVPRIPGSPLGADREDVPRGADPPVPPGPVPSSLGGRCHHERDGGPFSDPRPFGPSHRHRSGQVDGRPDEPGGVEPVQPVPRAIGGPEGDLSGSTRADAPAGTRERDRGRRAQRRPQKPPPGRRGIRPCREREP